MGWLTGRARCTLRAARCALRSHQERESDNGQEAARRGAGRARHQRFAVVRRHYGVPGKAHDAQHEEDHDVALLPFFWV
jgi:hypothetical protein